MAAVRPGGRGMPHDHRATALALAGLLALAGCGGEEVVSPRPPPIVALYGPASETQLTPFPSDRYTVDDASTPTGKRVHVGPDNTADVLVAGIPLVVDQLAELDGFSTTGGIVAMFSGPLDVAGLAVDHTQPDVSAEGVPDAAFFAMAGSPLWLIDVDPASPRFGEPVGLIPRWWEQAKDEYYTTDEFTLIVEPAQPLLPGGRYLFVATDGLRARSGGAVARSADMDALLSSAPGDAYAASVHDALAVAEERLGLDPSRVVLATVFTTASVQDGIVAMGQQNRAAPAPALVEPWELAEESASDDRARFRAVFDSPEYRRPKPDGKWRLGEGGAPLEVERVGLEVFLAFSDAQEGGPRPVVIYQHGLGGDKDGGWGTAERLAELGVAVFSIDSPEHGSRATGGEVTAIFSFFGIDAETQSFDIGKARDNFRQMASDQLELVRLIGSLEDLDLLPVGAPDGVADLDTSRILYIGHSFGAVQGPTLFALAPEVRHAVWNVGGDGLMMLLRDSATFSVIVNSLKPAGTSNGAVARFFAVTQAIVDPGDPLNYARHVAAEPLAGTKGWAPRDVLLQVVVDDGIVPNSTSEALARAAGLVNGDPVRAVSGLATLALPASGNLPGGATGILSQFDRMDGGKLATHGSLIFSEEARAQYVEFFATGLAEGHATVPPPY